MRVVHERALRGAVVQSVAGGFIDRHSTVDIGGVSEQSAVAKFGGTDVRGKHSLLKQVNRQQIDSTQSG